MCVAGARARHGAGSIPRCGTSRHPRTGRGRRGRIRPRVNGRTPGTVPCRPGSGHLGVSEALSGDPSAPSATGVGTAPRLAWGACRSSPGPTWPSATCASAATSSAGRRTRRRPAPSWTGSTTPRAATPAFVDTAESYGSGTSERILGDWMADRGVRDQRGRGHQGVPGGQGAPAGGRRDPGGVRALPAQPADRPDRPVLRPLRRRDDAAGGDPRGVRRAGAGGQGPLRGGVELLGGAAGRGAGDVRPARPGRATRRCRCTTT